MLTTTPCDCASSTMALDLRIPPPGLPDLVYKRCVIALQQLARGCQWSRATSGAQLLSAKLHRG